MKKYFTPELRWLELETEGMFLTASGSQNEDVGGKDDPEINW